MQNRLRQLRRERGMPLLELAAKAQASTATISMIERFAHLPGIELRERLAQALGVPTTLIWPDLATPSAPATSGTEEDENASGTAAGPGPRADVCSAADRKDLVL
jgi:transcriptional regulator with XRE-family HTH domain